MPKAIADIRKPEIVEAAFRAIARHGLPMPSYDLIAQEAGISRQLIRHYFPEPQEMMLMLCDRLAASYRALLAKGIVAAQSHERLPLFLDFYFGFLEGKGLPKPADDAVYDAMFALAAGSGEIRANLREQYSLLHHVVAHEVQITHPELPQRACREVGHLFISLMYGHWKMVASLGMPSEHNRTVRQAMDRLIASYLANYDDPDEK